MMHGTYNVRSVYVYMPT
jgi:hypothetical protein